MTALANMGWDSWDSSEIKWLTDFGASSSPCSCWRQTSRRPPSEAARSWPGEMEELAFASHCLGFQTAFSHTSFGPPWHRAPPPATQRGYSGYLKTFDFLWDRCMQLYHSGDGSRNGSTTRRRCPSPNTFHELLQRLRHQLAVLLWLHHVPARISEVQPKIQFNCFL